MGWQFFLGALCPITQPGKAVKVRQLQVAVQSELILPVLRSPVAVEGDHLGRGDEGLRALEEVIGGGE